VNGASGKVLTVFQRAVVGSQLDIRSAPGQGGSERSSWEEMAAGAAGS
jgi:hypothetical protein